MNLKRNITKRTAALISDGARTVGFKEAYNYIEERLYSDEAESVRLFCSWLAENQCMASRETPFIESNYPNLYKNYFLKELKNS